MGILYMILLGIFILLRYMCMQGVNEIKRQAQSKKETQYKVYADEKIASIEITGMDHYTENVRISYNRRADVMHCTIRFSYYDEAGEQYYGVYSTRNSESIGRNNKVAYKIHNPSEYRVLREAEFRPSWSTIHTTGLMGICLSWIIYLFFRKDKGERIITIINIAILVLTILVIKSFYDVIVL